MFFEFRPPKKKGVFFMSESKTTVKRNARYWWAVLYPENMLEGWQEDIGDLVQLPYAYCIHSMDKDTKSEHRKDHIHLILVFPNTTTQAHAESVFQRLCAEGKKAFNTIQSIINIRNSYDYLIHDTETCRKKGKELYSEAERIKGNCFDIGAYEQVGLAEKNEICRELCSAIVDNGFTNFVDFYSFVIATYEDSNYFDILKTYSGLFERLCKGNYHKWQENLQNR